jgi:hypothetical protein
VLVVVCCAWWSPRAYVCVKLQKIKQGSNDRTIKKGGGQCATSLCGFLVFLLRENKQN